MSLIVTSSIYYLAVSKVALNLLLMRHREPTKVAIFDTPMSCRKLPAVTS